jgi:DNA adenine methylase
LRYPGGKTLLTEFLSQTIKANDLQGGVYAEPFAGGAGAALGLLFSERVSEIHINDKDPRIYAFWRAILGNTEEFLRLIDVSPVTVRMWRRQKEVLKNPNSYSPLEVGFATFFVNRCNRSGVLNAGPIGGVKQDGPYKIGVRFNKAHLKMKIEKIAVYRERIRPWNMDAVPFLKALSKRFRNDLRRCLVYMDPPYFKKAETLYRFYFSEFDHERLADYLKHEAEFPWILSYDDMVKVRSLYPGRKKVVLKSYSVHTARLGRELMISDRGCLLPGSNTRI